MSNAERIESLKAKHAELDRRLYEEETRPMPDASVLGALKRQKLQIKDQLHALSLH